MQFDLLELDCFDLVMQTIGGTKNLRRKLRDMSLSPGRRGRWRLPQKIAYSQHLLLQFIEVMPGSWKNTKEKEKKNKKNEFFIFGFANSNVSVYFSPCD